MRTIITGIIVFALWATLASYIYVCKIQGFCSEPISLQAITPSLDNKTPADTLTKVVVKEQAVLPQNLVNYFEFDRSDYKVNDMTVKYYKEADLYLKENTNARLIITGHTDAIGTEKYNLDLGYRRAQSTKQYFEKAGIPAEKISVESKGETQPVDINSTTAGRANNRRTETIIKK